MGVPAHPHIQYYLWYQIRAQNSKFYILAISWKLYAEKFLETICWEILGNHILKNSSGCRLLFEGGNYGTMLLSKRHARGTRGAPAPRNLAKITLVRYLSKELYKGDLQLVLLAEPPRYGTINLHRLIQGYG